MTDVPDLITWWSGVLDRVERVARAVADHRGRSGELHPGYREDWRP